MGGTDELNERLTRFCVAQMGREVEISDLSRFSGGASRETWSFVVGFCTGGAAHTIADWLVTGGTRYLNGMGFRVTRDYSNHDRWPASRRRTRSWGR